MIGIGTVCPHCGGQHAGQCWRVKAIEYYPDGVVKRVEYHTVIDAYGLADRPPTPITLTIERHGRD